MDMADAMAYGGYRDAGYKYVCIDVSAPPDYEKGISVDVTMYRLNLQTVTEFITAT